MLFLCGVAFGRRTGICPVTMELSMVVRDTVGTSYFLSNFGAFCSGGSMEKVTYAFHPSNRFLALNS